MPERAHLIAHHLDRAGRADRGAELAALAVVEVEAGERGPVELDRGVRAVEPAEQAVDAGGEVDLGLEAGAPLAGQRLDRLVADDDAAGLELRPGPQAAHVASSAACVPGRERRGQLARVGLLAEHLGRGGDQALERRLAEAAGDRAEHDEVDGAGGKPVGAGTHDRARDRVLAS